MNKEQFKSEIASSKEHEWKLAFDSLDMTLEPFEETTDPDARKTAIQEKQAELVEWLKEIPGCNWSVGFVDNAEQNDMVVKWWFKDEDYPVTWPED